MLLKLAIFLLKILLNVVGFMLRIVGILISTVCSVFGFLVPKKLCITCKNCIHKPDNAFLCNRFKTPVTYTSSPLYTKTYNDVVKACFEFSVLADNVVMHNIVTKTLKMIRYHIFTARNK